MTINTHSFQEHTEYPENRQLLVYKGKLNKMANILHHTDHAASAKCTKIRNQ